MNPRALLRLSAFSLAPLFILQPAFAQQTYTVTSTADTNTVGTLRYAITQANANPGSTINFNNNLGTITLGGELPTISASVTINGGTGNTVSGNITKTGSGTLVFIGDNTYSGTTVISAGTLQIGNASTTGSLSSAVTNNAALVFKRSDAVTVTSIIGGNGTLTQAGNGTLTLAGNNTFSGATAITGGTLALGASGALQNSTLSYTIANGGTLSFGALSAATLGALSGDKNLALNGVTLTVGTNDASTSYSGVLSWGELVKAGTGTFTLSGTADNVGLTSSVNGGTLVLGLASSPSVHAIGGGEISVTIKSGGTLKFAGTGGDQIYTAASVALNTGGTLDLNGRNEGFNNLTGGGTVTNTAASTTGTLTLGEGNGSATFSGILQDGAGTTALTKAGTGTLTLSGNNTFTGTTAITGGTLTLGSGGALQKSTLTYTAANGGALSFGDLSAATLGALSGDKDLTLINLALTVGKNDASTTYSGAMSAYGESTLIKTGTGALTLSGADDNYGLTATVNAGTLVLAKAAGGARAIGGGDISVTINSGGTLQFAGTGGDQIFMAASVALNTDATLDLNGRNEGFNNLTGGGTVTNTATGTTGTMTLGENNGSATFSGVLQDGAGLTALTKTGNGTLTLTGTNTHTGGTTISSGTLQVGNAAATGSLVGDVAIASDGTLAFSRSGPITYPGNLSGTGSLVKLGSGTLTLTGSAAFVGSTTVHAGVLELSGGSVSSTTINNGGTVKLTGSEGDQIYSAAAVAVNTGGVLDLNGRSEGFDVLTGGGTVYNNAASTTSVLSLGENNGSATFSGVLRNGAGLTALTKTGNGTLTLTGANTHTGGTTISQGTLQIGSGGATGSIAGNIAIGSGGTLAFARSDAIIYAGSLSGIGSLLKLGDGTLTLSGANAFTGSTTVNAGVLALFGGSISDTTINQGGTLRLTGTNGNQIATPATVTLNAGGTLDLYGHSEGFSTLTGAGTVTTTTPNATSVLTLGENDSSSLFSGVLQNGAGYISLTKTGNGTLTLTGANTNLETTVSAGTLQIGNGGTTGSIASNVSMGSGSTLAFARSDALTYAGTISGTGSLLKLGAGTLTLTAFNSYSGTTTLSAGTLALSANGRLGNTGNITFTGGTLRYDSFPGGTDYSSRIVNSTSPVKIDTAVDTTFNGVLGSTNTGGLTKSGNANLSLDGGNTYTGPTTLSAGTLTLYRNGRLGSSGNITFTGGTLRYESSAAPDYFSRIVNSTSPVKIDVSQPLTFSGILDGTNTGGLTKSGADRLTLSGANAYTGTTTLAAGVLALSGGGTLGASGNITFTGGTLSTGTDFSSRIVNSTSPIALEIIGSTTLASALDGTNTGGLTKFGASTLTLTAENTYTGTTTITFGTLRIGSDGATGSIVADVAIESGGILNFARSGVMVNPGAISGAGLVTKTGTGTVALTGAITHTGGTQVSNGTLQIGNQGTTGSITGNVFLTSSGKLAFARSDDLTYGGTISGAGSFSKLGAGTLTLSGANTYTGTTTINAGTLQVGNGATSGTLPGGQVAVSSGATLAFARSDSITFAGSISGAGALAKLGTGTLTLSGSNSFTGGTTVNAGTLALSGFGNPSDRVFNTTINAGGTLRLLNNNMIGTSTVTVNGGTLDFNGKIDYFSALVLSSGGTVSGGGAFTLESGGTPVLRAVGGGNAGTISSGIGISSDFGVGGGAARTLEMNIAGNTTLAISGPITNSLEGTTLVGSLTKTGSGVLTLSGVNTYTGATAIDAGQLNLTGSATNSAFTVNTGGTLSGAGTLGALTIASGGTLSPGNSPGMLTAGATTWQGGGAFKFEINSASGTAGTSWDLLAIAGVLNLSATSGNKFTVGLNTLDFTSGLAGVPQNFSPGSNYAFAFVTTTGGITGFDPAAFTLSRTSVDSAINGTWSIAQNGNNLDLVYTAVPEPATWAALLGTGALAFATWRSRSKRPRSA